ncbi:MAG TPA: bifunctional protein-serine/threonine kinase/phosphatase [Candidatus Kapabacteria bacterium]|nr:bifunctional protein-serine/threonine kinase/phosphatase [Candidatus Kapabacteria bacterium]
MALTTPALRVRAAQASRAGRKPENEDAMGIRLPTDHAQTRKGLAMALADGVSGAGEGRRAAEVSVQGFLSDYYATPETWTVKTSAFRVLSALNRWLYGQGQQYTQIHQGFLTTFSALVLRSQTAHLFHVGDTRIQRLRDNTLEPLTLDHATRVGAEKTYLTRAFGMDWQVDIDYRAVDVQSGDIFLLSTDGVHEFLPIPQLKKLLAQARDNPDACCEALLDAAYNAGSDDNISCQVLVIDSLDAPAADDSRLHATRLPLLSGLTIGQHIDGMLVEAELHASPRSQLYRVHDTITRRTMALKMPSPQLGDDAEHLSRFALEDWIGQRIDHPNVVKGWPVPRQRQCLYLLQEYLEGETLSAWAEKNPRPPVQTVTSFAAQIIKGLRALHRRETLHQDIKPDNLFLCSDGTLKLIDLGSARVAGLEDGTSHDRPGAAEYAAPEYALNLPRDARSDQFSLAITLYELLTGKHPYGETYARAVSPADFQKLSYTSACRYNPHVPLWLDAALKKACSLLMDERYAALGEFLVDLESPNPTLAPVSARPWLERDPAGFWRGLALVMSLIALAELGVIIFQAR